MQSAKQKISDMASVAKEKMVICRAKADEKAEKAMARTKEEKEIAHQRRKAKEAEANMDMHMAKAAHAEEKLLAKQSHYHVTDHGVSHVDHGHLPHHVPMAAPAPTPVTGHGHVPMAAPAPTPVMGHGYGQNPPGATSVPPQTYPTTRHHHYGNDML
ncbi:hypothetical protein AALP_AA1G330500 [Arabis alpina]|uniref:Uncharacterized protein n=1 Tax=Arabis alpina TaxID=50452 RepID=A0A087HS93_ARAAL|nr:hypothetical protein AALP_AA1G330500 [Arabis alpina]